MINNPCRTKILLYALSVRIKPSENRCRPMKWKTHFSWNWFWLWQKLLTLYFHFWGQMRTALTVNNNKKTQNLHRGRLIPGKITIFFKLIPGRALQYYEYRFFACENRKLPIKWIWVLEWSGIPSCYFLETYKFVTTAAQSPLGTHATSSRRRLQWPEFSSNPRVGTMPATNNHSGDERNTEADSRRRRVESGPRLFSNAIMSWVSAGVRSVFSMVLKYA